MTPAISDPMRDALEKLVRTASLLQQNSEGCAVNHHGLDFEQQGLPGWLRDTKAAIDDAQAALASPPLDREAVIEEIVRERENYNGMHQAACIYIEKQDAVLEQAEIALDLAGLLLGGYLPQSSYAAVNDAIAAINSIRALKSPVPPESKEG
jgi:hypothetical protein